MSGPVMEISKTPAIFGVLVFVFGVILHIIGAGSFGHLVTVVGGAVVAYSILGII